MGALALIAFYHPISWCGLHAFGIFTTLAVKVDPFGELTVLGSIKVISNHLGILLKSTRTTMWHVCLVSSLRKDNRAAYQANFIQSYTPPM